MEAELQSLAKVSTASLAALCYCYILLPKLPIGKPRVLALLPVIFLFALLPLCFSTIHLRGICGFFLFWLGSFKLLLLAFQKGPLTAPGVSLPVFLALTALPIKIQYRNGEKQNEQKEKQSRTLEKSQIQSGLQLVSFVGYAAKGVLLSYIISIYRYRHRYPRGLVLGLYSLHVYLCLELVLGTAGLVSRTLIGGRLVLEPQFAPPYLSTSLQDFWSRRWNLMVTRLLHSTVYVPVRARWGPLAAVAAAFLVSGLMHEAMFYYLTLLPPTGEVTCFFVLQGISTAAEIALKTALSARGWKPLPRAIAAPLTVGYVFATGTLLFFPPLTRCDAEENVIEECRAMLDFGQRLSGRGLDLIRRR